MSGYPTVIQLTCHIEESHTFPLHSLWRPHSLDRFLLFTRRPSRRHLRDVPCGCWAINPHQWLVRGGRALLMDHTHTWSEEHEISVSSQISVTNFFCVVGRWTDKERKHGDIVQFIPHYVNLNHNMNGEEESEDSATWNLTVFCEQ